MAYGHCMIRWADGRFAHRFAGGPPPVKPPRYGMARAVHEWKMCGRSVLGAVIAMVLLQGAVWYVDDAGRSRSPAEWQLRMLMVIGISLVIALSYTIRPKQPERPEQPRRLEQPERPGKDSADIRA